MTEVTQAYVKKLFKYDRKTGELISRATRGRAKAGQSSKSKDKDGYLVVGFNGKLYRTHRVIWLYVHGEWPKNDCDHINRIKDDNRISNLRDITRAENKQNQTVTRLSKSGVKGVYWANCYQRWVAEIGHENKQIVIGQFKEKEDAIDAYKFFAIALHKFNPSAQE